jgi:hypothetical protein
MNHRISLRALLKSLQVTQGMLSLVLFQHVEPNFTNSIMMFFFQKIDLPYNLNRQATLEVEIRTLIL